MICLSGTFKWRLGQIRVREREQSKVFLWLTKESPIRKTLTSVSFSYLRGWEVELLVPFDWGPKHIDDLQCATLRLLGLLPMRIEDAELQVVDFVLPPNSDAADVTS